MRRFWAFVGFVALVTGGSALPAVAHGPGHVRDDQPLTGYTIDNPPLDPLTVAGGGTTTVLQGVFHHAAYDIEIPPDWNGDLVMYAHGYRGQGTVLTVDPPPFGLRQKVIDEGYAWAASSYYDNGYDVRAGVLSTHDLAQFALIKLRWQAGKSFDRHHRRHQVFLVGVSMGGHVTGRSVEEFPKFYDGALPMCGVVGDNELFDFFFDENLVAQDLAGVNAYPPPADYLTANVPTIQEKLGLTTLKPGGPDTTTALGKQFRSIVINRSGGPRPGAVQAFAVWKDFMFTLWTPDGPGTLAQHPGRVGTNVDTVYDPNTPVDVNATVTRVAPTDPKSRASKRLTQSPQILGKPRVPVLSVHGLGDLFVPFSMEQIYARDVAAHHRSDLLVQRAIRSAGHCEFNANEAGKAFDDLVAWVATGQRPAGDNVTDPAAVADPNFGCAFTDHADKTGSRLLFPPCP
jgi:pimeloyl-ACP methyl ester carboxylesterase